MFDITLEQGHGLATMLGVAAAAIGLSAVFYRRAYGALRAVQWQTLLVLRIVAILIVVLLLFRPVHSYTKDRQEKRALVFLVDSSASMSIADDSSGEKRFDRARRKVTDWCEQLGGDFELHVVEFSEQANPLGDATALISVAPDGKSTSLSRALEAAGQVSSANVEAVFLLSDGIDNVKGNPLRAIPRDGVVVHCVGVGSSLRGDVSYRDVQVAGMSCPPRLMLANLARITASVDAVGLGGSMVKVLLEEEGEQIGEAELTLDDRQGGQEVVFEFRPAEKGRRTYTVRVPSLAEERIEENNRRSAVADVIEPGIRVLYIEGTLRGDYGAIVNRFLQKDPDLEFCALVQTKPNVFLCRTNIEGLQLSGIPTDAETLEMFDVFILGDLDASFIQPEQQNLIVERIRNGAGLIMLGGYHSLGPGGYQGTPIGGVLPMQLGDREVGQVDDPFLPVLTPEGVRHPLFTNIEDFFPTEQGDAVIEGLPPLKGCTRVAGARPGATVLANCPTEAGPMPVLAVQNVPQGRTAVFCGDTTRDWQQAMRAQDQDPVFLRFWGQMVRWLAGRSESVGTEMSVVARTDKPYYDPGEKIEITAVVRDSEGEGTADAKVVARLNGPDDLREEVALSAGSGSAGHYGATFEPKTAGTYEILVEAALAAQTDQTDPIAVEVGRPYLEYEKLDLNDALLEEIAKATGGRYVPLTTADHLIDRLDRSMKESREFIQTKLYWPPGLWILFVSCLTAEWVLRKRFQLR